MDIQVKDVEYLEFLWPMRHYLVSCGDTGGKSNIIAVSFCMPVSKEPPMVACAISKGAYSTELISASQEFVVNVPTSDLSRQIYFCGTHSGRDTDKFEQTGLTPRPARRLNAPIIEECVAFMECRVVTGVRAGDKVLFVGEVLEAYATDSAVSGKAGLRFAEGDFPSKVYGTRFV